MTDSNKEPEEKRPSQPALAMGVVAGFTTIGAYLTAFTYEWGFTSHFGIPRQFITLDWTTVLIAAGAVAGVLSLAFMILEYLSWLVLPLSVPPTLKRSIVRWVLLSLAFVIPGAFWFTGLVSRVICISCVVALFAFSEFVWPFITQGKTRGWLEKLKAQEALEASQQTLITLLLRHAVAHAFLLLVLALLWIALTAYSIGHFTASTQKQFLVVNTSPEAVVLREYHDQLICAYFDRETKQISGTYFVLKTAGGPEVTLAPEEVGPLHMKE